MAASNLGQFDEAKADLTAVCKADPKNREARTVLEVVLAALKEQKGKDEGHGASNGGDGGQVSQ